ncbi:MAG TPA: type II secretion system protein GspM [Xanthomonadales bacterium]|nr:type II secretion system protein GspM [Xanthomonadales bacterium]
MIVASLKQGNSKLTAILLLVIALILVYLLCFHWFIVSHLSYGEEISELQSQLNRYRQVAAQKELVEEQLESLQSRRNEYNLFLPENDFNEAAAAMSERLSQMLASFADESCQIVSRQPERAREVERFEKVTVNVRMRCDIEDLMQMLYNLENGTPMVFTEELTVIKPRARRRRNDQATNDGQALDIRFNMSGYLRKSGS